MGVNSCGVKVNEQSGLPVPRLTLGLKKLCVCRTWHYFLNGGGEPNDAIQMHA